jgi:hypothetical protein
MSASREKKKRQEVVSGGGADPRAARAAQERAAERRSNIMYITIAVVFVVVAVGLVVYNSGIIQRSKTAVTIDGENYTVAEVSYYYGSAYQSFLNSYGSYASLFGLDTSTSLKEQNAWGGDDQTWDEYFKDSAVSNMQFVHAAVKAAKAEGMSLGDEELESFNSTVESVKSQASSNGYSYKSYLTAVYGSVMTPSVYESCLKDSLLANKYATEYYNSLSFTDDEITAYYEENKDSYDLVSGAYVSISGVPETQTDDDGNTIEATDEETAEALAQAEETANAILAAYKEGGDLETLASDYGASYSSSDSLSYSSTVYGEWLFDSARTSGDVAVVEDEDNSYFYVVLFNDRQQDDALDYSVRHILVTEDNLDLGEDEEADDDMILAKAQEILDSWDGTEDNFAALAEEYSQDSGSNTNGGLYENVAKGTMATNFNDWCYEDGRKPGDTGIVSTSYGEHIMYFVGYGDEEYWHYACNSQLVSNAYSDWETELTDSVTAEVQSGMDSVGY